MKIFNRRIAVFAVIIMLFAGCTTEHIASPSTVVVTQTDLSGLTSAVGTIKFSANSGSGTMADMTADVGSATVLPLCSFTEPSCKKFGHWNTAADGSGYSYIDGANVKDLAVALVKA
ncbi:MAG: hypothetical protein IKP67_06130, partial [Spirochaetales bacterium]|nr:hypothetical protein [Spirochaetales bacterium]